VFHEDEGGDVEVDHDDVHVVDDLGDLLGTGLLLHLLHTGHLEGVVVYTLVQERAIDDVCLDVGLAVIP